ncbi:MAG TPA: hypothetical protein VFG55_05870, partial [Rhodanobacteraceae bacterium]|nr:hypothetical protein [Rhodanobacteraceae bacterium]
MTNAYLLGTALLFAAGHADAEWQPQWIGIWEPETSFHDIDSINVAVDADGSALAGVAYRYTIDEHPTIVHFDDMGNPGWVGEGDAALQIGPIALLANARVASVGNDADGIRVQVRERAGGTPVWTGTSDAGRISFDERFIRKSIAQTPNGDVLVAASEPGDYVVARWSEEGKELPEWRWHCSDGGDALVDDIVALADGGAAMVGHCGLQSGYLTVRFDVAGGVVFDDTELGDIGNALDPASIEVDAAGAIVVAADPESVHGVPLAEVWKLAP